MNAWVLKSLAHAPSISHQSRTLYSSKMSLKACQLLSLEYCDSSILASDRESIEEQQKVADDAFHRASGSLPLVRSLETVIYRGFG